VDNIAIGTMELGPLELLLFLNFVGQHFDDETFSLVLIVIL